MLSKQLLAFLVATHVQRMPDDWPQKAIAAVGTPP